MQQLKDLPIGESDITKLLTGNFTYVDKTKYAYEMVRKPSKYFLSRPRRFGKSTLLSTLNEIFKGNKELFKDQWIYNSPYTWDIYPIIRLDFNVAFNVDLEWYIRDALRTISIENDIFNETEFNQLPYSMYFRALIYKLHKKYSQRVVILIDEYDKPILDMVDNIPLAIEKREILKGFYSVMKGLDEYIQFIFLTGVSRFSKVGIFSGLNNLNDISMTKQYDAVCGITEEELVNTYHTHINNLAIIEGIDYQTCLNKIKDWYNGFNFCRNAISVYNPFSTLQLFQHQKFSNYWFATGSPTFLIKLIKKETNLNIEQFDGCQVQQNDFDSFEIDNLRLTAILFQTGYLTIKSYDVDLDAYTLTYPNREINKSFKESLLNGLTKQTDTNAGYLFKIIKGLKANDIEEVINNLKQIFLNLDYDIVISKEQHYQNIIYLIFQLLGYLISTEYKTSRGRIDAIIQTSTHVYIFEFKLDKTAQEAIAQIKSKNYYERFTKQGKDIYLIGINFNSNERCIDDYVVEAIASQ